MRRPGRWLPMWSGSPASASRSGAAPRVGVHEHHAFPHVDRRAEQPAGRRCRDRGTARAAGERPAARRRGRSANRGTSTRCRRRGVPATVEHHHARGAGTGCGTRAASPSSWRTIAIGAPPTRTVTKSPGCASCSTCATTCQVRPNTSRCSRVNHASSVYAAGSRRKRVEFVGHRRASPVCEPAAVVRDVGRARGRDPLAEEAGVAAPVGELDRPDRERRRDVEHEFAEPVAGHLPQLGRDRGSAGLDADEARLRRLGGERVQPVDRRGRGRAQRAGRRGRSAGG